MERNVGAELKEWYVGARNRVKEKLAIDNIMAVPNVEKVVLNIGLKEAIANSKTMDTVFQALRAAAGQEPVKSVARKSIAGFKIREEMKIGVFVTLRGKAMYNFLRKMIHIALPRVRDFKGINEKSFDGRGNYTLGVTEQIIFPEIDIDKVNKITGMDITFVTTAGTDEEAYELLKELGMPFRNIKK